jgi:uncharacterized damage-inducible protein DinB
MLVIPMYAFPLDYKKINDRSWPMNIRDILLLDFDQEMANTRKMLERVPLNKSDWKPHNKSMTMGRLAGHIAELPGFAMRIMDQDSLDLATMHGEGYRPFIPTSTNELLTQFDNSTAEIRKALAAASDQQLSITWTMQLGGKIIVSLPRMSAVRSTCLNHLIHHRAQLGVYFRLNDIPLPALYGPSADEQG